MKYSKAVAFFSVITLVGNSAIAFADEPRQAAPIQTSSTAKMPVASPTANTAVTAAVAGQNAVAQLVQNNPTASTTTSSKTTNTSSSTASAPSVSTQSSGQSNVSSPANAQAPGSPTTNTNQAPPAQAILTGAPDIWTEPTGTTGSGTLADPKKVVTYSNGTSKTVKTNYADTVNNSATNQTETKHEEITTYKWEAAAWKLISKSGSETINETWNDQNYNPQNLPNTSGYKEGKSSKYWELIWTIDAAGQPSAQPAVLKHESWDNEEFIDDPLLDQMARISEHWTQQNGDPKTRTGYSTTHAGNTVGPNTTDIMDTWQDGIETKTWTSNRYVQNNAPPFTLTHEKSTTVTVLDLDGYQTSKIDETSEKDYVLTNGVEELVRHRTSVKIETQANQVVYYIDNSWTVDLVTRVTTYSFIEDARGMVTRVTVKMNLDTNELLFVQIMPPNNIWLTWNPGDRWTDEFQTWFLRVTGMLPPPSSVPPTIT